MHSLDGFQAIDTCGLKIYAKRQAQMLSLMKSSSIFFKLNTNRPALVILALTATLGSMAPGHAYDPSMTTDLISQDITAPAVQPRYEPSLLDSWSEKTYYYLRDKFRRPDPAPAVYPDPETGQPIPVDPNYRRVPRSSGGIRG